ncbi:MAG: hypothetical protein JWM21_4644 [Acidobacteria bacterium]|nr:hypothetical protein [Acidobacteriota bacterium]
MSKRLNFLIVLILLTWLTVIAQAPDQEKARVNSPPNLQHAQELLSLSQQQNYVNHHLALETAQEALALWQLTGDKAGIAQTYAQIARCYLVQSDLLEATQNYERTLVLWRELNDTKQQATTLIMLGFIEVRKGEWSSAISLLTQAQSFLSEQDATPMGQIADALGVIFNESGSPDKGLIQFRRAQEYYRQTPDERDDKRMMIDLGNTYFLLGDFSEALTYLQQALESFEPQSLDAAESHEDLGRVYSSLGEYAAAIQHLQSAIPIYERVGNPQEAARSRALLGQVYQHQGQPELARKYYEDSLIAFQALSDQLNQAAIHYSLGRLDLQGGQIDRAENHLRQSIEETENIRRVSTSRDLTTAFSASVHERYAAYIECLMRKHQSQPQQGLDILAFETNELSHARSLRELLRATQTNLIAGLDPQLAEQEKTLRQSLRVKEDSKVALLSTQYKKEELDALESELAQLEREYKQVTDTIRQRYPAYERITSPTTLSLQQIQAQVLTDDQTMLLEYSLGVDKSYVWAVTHTGFSSYELPGRAQIEAAVRQLYNLLTAPQPRPGEGFEQARARTLEAQGQVSSQISALSKTLLAPVADKLGTRRLLIVADGALQYIPFQALVMPANGNAAGSPANALAVEERALILDHEIISEPSASALALVLSESANRKPASKSVAILADPVFDIADSRIKSNNTGSLQAAAAASPNSEVTRAWDDVGVTGSETPPRLFSSREEADAIMSVIPWRTGFKAVGFDASRATAMGSDLGRYRVVHFATHALLDNEHPDLSGIILSLVDAKGQRQDGFLRLHDIYNLKLPVDLVVLSACQTGLGKDVKGEGLIGLTRGFMYAGASGVVASLWKVDDEATAALMKNFYVGLFEKGLSPAAALREAQLAMRQEKRWQEPYYWAGFVIQGQYAARGHNSYQPTPAVKLAVVSSAGLVLSLSVILVLWRRRRRNL